MAGAYETKQYRNVFAEYGYSEEEIEKRVQETFETIFHGSEEERFYHEAGEDMGFMEDTGNHDARTEGMSYGMMVCVQLDKKEEFDRLWKWTRTYMYMDEGPGKNYFAWSCALDGTRKCGRTGDRTGKSILLWHCSLHQEDGETERAFLITAGRQKRFCMSVCIRENRDIRAIRCGSLPTN